MAEADEVEAWNILIFYQNKHVDNRMDVFNVDLEYEDESIVLTGEVSRLDLIHPLKEELEEHFPEKTIINHTELVTGIGYGLVGEKFISVKAGPGGDSDVTQLIFGDPVHILKKEGDWLRIQGPDLYLGWVNEEGILPMGEEELGSWREGNFFIVYSEKTLLYSGPDSSEREITEIIHGSRLRIIEEKDSWSQVFLPGDLEGWVATDDLVPERETQTVDVESIISVAKKFLGTPYVWAGTHIEGTDCSGFIQRVLAVNGIYYPRDSDQQYIFSDQIDREKMTRGDLVFFLTYRKGPSHLGIYLGDGDFIHAGSGAGKVIIESLDPESENYNARLDNGFLGPAKIRENFEFLAPWVRSNEGF